MRKLLILILTLHYSIIALAGGESPPSNMFSWDDDDSTYGSSDSRDIMQDCVGKGHPNIVIDNIGNSILQQKEPFRTCYRPNQKDWYWLEIHSAGDSKMRYSLVDKTSHESKLSLYPTSDIIPGRLCLKYFGIPKDSYKDTIWNRYCDYFSVGYDDIGIVSSSRSHLPISIDTTTDTFFSDLVLSRVVLKRRGKDYQNTSYTVQTQYCSSSLNGVCRYTAFDWYKKYGDFRSSDSPWGGLGNLQVLYPNTIPTISSSKAKANGASLLADNGPIRDSASYNICLLRVPPTYHYPSANFRNPKQSNNKVGVNYNLSKSEKYSDHVMYANGARYEVCGFLAALDDCSVPYKGLFDKSLIDQDNSRLSDDAYIIASSFFGCVTEPLRPPPPNFNSYLIANIAPKIELPVTGTFLKPVITVTNGMKNQADKTSMTLIATYMRDETNQDLNDVTAISCGRLQSKVNGNFFSNGKSNKICAVIPYEQPNEVCICYQDQCISSNNSDVNYLECTNNNGRPTLNGKYQLSYTFDNKYGHGLKVALVNDASYQKPKDQLKAIDYSDTVFTNYQNTVFEIVYKQQAMDLVNERVKSYSAASYIAPTNSSYIASRNTLAGFSNDFSLASITQGLTYYSTIPVMEEYVDSSNQRIQTPRYAKIYTPNHPSPDDSDNRATCLRYKTVGPIPTAIHNEYVVPAGLRSRYSNTTAVLNGVEAAVSNFGNFTGNVVNSPDSYCRYNPYYQADRVPACPISFETSAVTSKIDTINCKHESSGVDNVNANNYGALEIIEPGVYVSPDANTEGAIVGSKICLFTNDVVTYYLMTGIQANPKVGVNSSPYLLGCVDMPIEACPALTTRSVASGFLTWQAMLAGKSVTQSCPTEATTDQNGTLMLEAPKEYIIGVTDARCDAACQNNLKAAQLLLQQGYRKYCLDHPASSTDGIPNLPADSSSYKASYGMVDSNNKFIPDCEIGVDNTLLQQVQSLMAAIPNNIATLEAMPIDTQSALVNPSGVYKPFIFDKSAILTQMNSSPPAVQYQNILGCQENYECFYRQLNNRNPERVCTIAPVSVSYGKYINDVWTLLSTDNSGQSCNKSIYTFSKSWSEGDTSNGSRFNMIKEYISYQDPYTPSGIIANNVVINANNNYLEKFGGNYGNNSQYNSGNLYYINFKKCNGDIGSASCSLSQMIKAQKYLYLFLSHKEDGRNLTLSEEAIIRTALSSYINGSLINNANDANYLSTAMFGSNKANASNVSLSSSVIANNPLQLIINNLSVTRTCSKDGVSTVTNSCKINKAIDFCPSISNGYHSVISGNAAWSGFNFWRYSYDDGFISNRFSLANLLSLKNTTQNQLGIDTSNINQYLYYKQTNNGANLKPGVIIPNWINDYSYNVESTTYTIDQHTLATLRMAFNTPLFSSYSSIGLWGDKSSSKVNRNQLMSSYSSIIGNFTSFDGPSKNAGDWSTIFNTFMNNLKLQNNFYAPMLKVGYVDFMIEGTCPAGKSAKPIYISHFGRISNNPVRACRVYFHPIGYDHMYFTERDITPTTDGLFSLLGGHWMPVKNPCQ